ncbi:MAG TPA: hypothetical protein VFB43_02255 [Terracidiphilus sp.]|nr:hypothetical protein [Terracidiphilus sp.]
MPKLPADSAKNVKGDSDTFTSFMRRLMQVPHSEIKTKLDAERKAKRTPKGVSRASGVSSKGH